MDDLISRALALEVINAVKSITWSQSGKVLCDKMYSQIKDLSTVNAAPVVHGRWINIPDKPEWDQKMCSVCGDYRCCQGNYCPNCGAKMENVNINE